MSKQYRSVKKRRILRVFFLVSFVLTLFLSHVFIATNSFAFGTVKAQNQNVSQVVAKGIEYYNQGKFREAVKEWELALKRYKKLPEQAVVRGNLAKAYQKIGDLEQSVKQWEQVVKLHRQLQNTLETGRAITELAQAYSSLGQPKKAI